MTQREASAQEKAAFRAAGQVSETIRMRAMARPVGREGSDAGDAVLTELKAVDGAYPLYGTLTARRRCAARPRLAADRGLDRAGAGRAAGRCGPGDRLRFGEGRVPGRRTHRRRAGPARRGLHLGAGGDRVDGGLAADRAGPAGQPLHQQIPDPPARRGLAGERQRPAEGGFPEARAGRSGTGDAAAPGASRFFSRMGQFLSLIGLAALIIAGIGVSNGVSSYLRLKREGIATLKALGATSADISRMYLAQVGLVAGIAVVAGLVAGRCCRRP